MNNTWKYVKPLENEEAITAFETTYDVKVPKLVKGLALKYNAGRPSKRVFDVKGREECVFQQLLSFNKSDRTNIYTAMDVLKKEGHVNVIPFAMTPSGDYICIDSKTSKVMLWDAEQDQFLPASTGALGFMQALR